MFNLLSLESLLHLNECWINIHCNSVNQILDSHFSEENSYIVEKHGSQCFHLDPAFSTRSRVPAFSPSLSGRNKCKILTRDFEIRYGEVLLWLFLPRGTGLTSVCCPPNSSIKILLHGIVMCSLYVSLQKWLLSGKPQPFTAETRGYFPFIWNRLDWWR